jgi:alpha-tubulin suppressor-like RCC1 family protein
MRSSTVVLVVLVLALALAACKRAAAPPPPLTRQLAAGAWTSCLLNHGSVTCWGKFQDDAVHAPTRIATDNATSISIGLTNTCVVDSSGHVSCWGIDWTKKHPIGDVPYRVGHLDKVIQVASGRSHICAVTEGGDVACWGSATSAIGHLSAGLPVETPTPMGVSDVVEVSAGDDHTCLRHRDGGVSCVGEMSEASPRSMHRVVGFSEVTAIASGDNFVCGLTRSREVWCAGANRLGQLGGGDHDVHDAPVRVRGLEGIRAISAAGPHACALAEDGSVWCWGSEYGHGIMPSRGDDEDHGPIRIADIANAVELAVGSSHACAGLADRTITCWGNSRDGQTGHPELTSPHPPAAVVLGE